MTDEEFEAQLASAAKHVTMSGGVLVATVATAPSACAQCRALHQMMDEVGAYPASASTGVSPISRA
jgi:hypothetical protein